MTNSIIEGIFETALKTLTTYIRTDNVAWPNKTFSRPSENGWYEIDHIPGEPYQAALGEDAPNRWVGIYQITICVKIDSGKVAANARYEAIAGLFSRGSIFSGVEIERVYSGPEGPEEDHYRLPVRIVYRADIEN